LKQMPDLQIENAAFPIYIKLELRHFIDPS
jgi:hypothetical protein